MTEQELMLTSLLNCERADLYVDKKPLTPAQEKELAVMIARRKKGEPLQHILGHCEFMALKFLVDKRALIPRPETELLVEAVLEKAKTYTDDHIKILDVGTGSGNIAVSLAKYIPRCSVTAVDISGGALDLARENAQLNGVEDKIEFIRGDLFPPFMEGAKDRAQARPFFDIIVSNPPYVKKGVIAKLSLEVQAEPKVALDGGEDGLSFYRRIVNEAPSFLKGNGWLFLEIGDGKREDIARIFDGNDFFVSEFQKDYQGIERIFIARKKNG